MLRGSFGFGFWLQIGIINCDNSVSIEDAADTSLASLHDDILLVVFVVQIVVAPID